MRKVKTMIFLLIIQRVGSTYGLREIIRQEMKNILSCIQTTIPTNNNFLQRYLNCLNLFPQFILIYIIFLFRFADRLISKKLLRALPSESMEEFVANVEINSFFSNYMNLGQLHISLNEQALYLIKLFGPSKRVPGSWKTIVKGVRRQTSHYDSLSRV